MGGTRTAFVCAYCKAKGTQPTNAVNRARKAGLRLYCNRTCAGLGRRTNKTKAQKVAEKRLYDMEYREKNLATLKAKEAAYFQRTYDPVTAAAHRKTRMPYHVEYCRRPEYKKWKAQYDKKYNSQKDYGPFAEAAMLITDLRHEIKGRISRNDIYKQNGTLCKTQKRRRETAEERPRERPRYRQGNRRYPASNSTQP
jgi:hypothetical protein